MALRKAEARWEGSLKDGKGQMRLGGGAYEGPYTFRSRFEDGEGTNPEELIAAAHAGCFSMQLSGVLGEAGYTPSRVETRADVHLTKTDTAFAITKIDLHTQAEVPGISDPEFQELAEKAKRICPVSGVLAAAEITVDAALLG